MNFQQHARNGVAALALLAGAGAAFGFDSYGPFTLLSISAPQSIRASTTNSIVGVAGFAGTVAVITSVTSNNVAAGEVAQLTVTLEGSSNGRSNWVTLSNVALSTSATVAVTNTMEGLGTNSTGTVNSFYRPSVNFTNSATATVSGSSIIHWGLDARNLPNFIRARYTYSGTNCAYGVSMLLIGQRAQPW